MWKDPKISGQRDWLQSFLELACQFGDLLRDWDGDMHEVSVMEKVISEVERVAHEHGLVVVTKFTLKIGALSGIIPEALEFAFQGLRMGTALEKAEMKLEVELAKFKCTVCEREIEVGEFEYVCPDCGGALAIISGTGDIQLLTVEGISRESSAFR